MLEALQPTRRSGVNRSERRRIAVGSPTSSFGYNNVHLHSGLGYVTPNDRHEGRDTAILAKRDDLYAKAKSETPRRWSGDARNWTPIGDVTLNPQKTAVIAA